MKPDAEIAVVGAGIDGSATARALARHGRSVVLLEQFELGHARGSSHGSSRIFRLSYPDEHYVRLAQQRRRRLAGARGRGRRDPDRSQRLARPRPVRGGERAGAGGLRRAPRAADRRRGPRALGNRRRGRRGRPLPARRRHHARRQGARCVPGRRAGCRRRRPRADARDRDRSRRRRRDADDGARQHALFRGRGHGRRLGTPAAGAARDRPARQGHARDGRVLRARRRPRFPPSSTAPRRTA